jgi:hypothetical protein
MDWQTKLKKRKILSSLKTICAVALLGLSTTSCQGAPIPAWNGRLFYGDADKEGLTRNHPKDHDFISCRNPEDRVRFNDVVCMRSADFKSFMDTYIGGCEKWKQGRPGTILIDSELFFRLLMIGRGEESIKLP